MRRALVVALAAVLVPTATATAASRLPGPPLVRGTVLGGVFPIRVTASVTPQVHPFGDAITANVVVFADRKWVDPSRVRTLVDFAPYEATEATEHESVHGRVVELTWSWRLTCLTVTCVPVRPPSDLFHVFHFRPVEVDVLGKTGKVAYGTITHFPGIKAFSQITPEIIAFLKANKGIDWQYSLEPPAATFRVAPGLVFWLALALASICGAAGLAIVVRWGLRFRSPAFHAAAGATSSPLERALALFFWAGGRGDETLQRKALERVAAELPFDVGDLSDTTRALAWSPESPAPDEVEEISERAGVPTHSVTRPGA